MAEPLIRGSNIVSAGAAGVFYLLGWKNLATAALVLNGLDVVGRQVSVDYREVVNRDRPPLAGLAFIPAIRQIKWG